MSLQKCFGNVLRKSYFMVNLLNLKLKSKLNQSSVPKFRLFFIFCYKVTYSYPIMLKIDFNFKEKYINLDV